MEGKARDSERAARWLSRLKKFRGLTQLPAGGPRKGQQMFSTTENVSQPGNSHQPQAHQGRDTVRLAVLRYLLNSSQKFRDLSRGKQITEIREHFGWCDSSILTVARSLSYWQNTVRVATASPDVEKKRFGKAARNHNKSFDKLGRKENESLSDFQQRVLEELPEDLRELAQAQLGVEPDASELEIELP